MNFLQQRKSFIWKHHKVKTWVTDNEDNKNNNHDINFEDGSTTYNESEY